MGIGGQSADERSLWPDLRRHAKASWPAGCTGEQMKVDADYLFCSTSGKDIWTNGKMIMIMM